MKERPILFSAPMVRAILEGQKTQTRRIVKQRIIPVVDECFRVNGKWCNKTFDYDLGALCPYGQPEDRLWVRETFGFGFNGAGSDCVVYSADNKSYHADYAAKKTSAESTFPAGVKKLKPSIFMPRWASRITLEIVSIRVERLQDIDDSAAGKEGVEFFKYTGPYCDSGKLIFKQLWESINGSGSWAINPWVWVIEFRRVDQ
jgi:hypothetical protein